MSWFELFVLAIYIQAFFWYGRLSYVQGVLDRHHDPDSKPVRKVLEAGYRRRAMRLAAAFSGRGDNHRAP
jgi:hypothetical protein